MSFRNLFVWDFGITRSRLHISSYFYALASVRWAILAFYCIQYDVEISSTLWDDVDYIQIRFSLKPDEFRWLNWIKCFQLELATYVSTNIIYRTSVNTKHIREPQIKDRNSINTYIHTLPPNYEYNDLRKINYIQ